ncbi:hypothetical protein RSSM_03569 [Rhodopirellula sallentina SM41]|uniref:Uncharacterized protein n=1 Tax=Rhodopirellula sallentina SM41 TaxID=1263870 RepID=M5U0M5_9BACT|nr:hypothetical protein RSSM_03569 [Rhodopirellula sallentina SM41]
MDRRAVQGIDGGDLRRASVAQRLRRSVIVFGCDVVSKCVDRCPVAAIVVARVGLGVRGAFERCMSGRSRWCFTLGYHSFSAMRAQKKPRLTGFGLAWLGKWIVGVPRCGG